MEHGGKSSTEYSRSIVTVIGSFPSQMVQKAAIRGGGIFWHGLRSGPLAQPARWYIRALSTCC